MTDTADEAAPRRPRPRPRLLLGAVAAAIVGVAAVAVLRQPPEDPDGLVILYGDSLSLEASGAFLDALERTSEAEVLLRVVPATSVCDARPTMEQDVPAAPDVVVIQFVGNNSSPCTAGPDGVPLTGQGLADRTAADARAAVELWTEAGARVVLVGGPAAPGLPGGADAAIAEAYNEIVNEWAGRDLGRVRYADAAAAVSGPDHEYAAHLPCRDGEGEDDGCTDGEVTVRSPDRIHFCPGDAREEDTIACPVPSPGAIRFGEEMARVTRLALDPGY